jgi:S-adenosylmethionine:tRNA ribosyltransferase-isomerase
MHISDFDYDLPPELIAREPVRPRDAGRMMVLDATSGERRDTRFIKLPEFLRPSDLLVLNDTRVIRARMHGRLERQSGASREMEVFFAEPSDHPGVWRVLCKPGRRIRTGDRVVFAGGAFYGVFRKEGHEQEALRELELISSDPVEVLLERHGEIPLPPYIERRETDADAIDYQTVFAQSAGAVAAPTAGLHFTDAMLHALKECGVEIVTITLHVGIGTFLPVRTLNPEEHILRPERFEISQETAERLSSAKSAGRRIVAVGTTTTRTLEFAMERYGGFKAAAGEADIFILPGFRFKAVDALLTNFHLPRSTLLMLVSAFAGREAVLSAYVHAVRERYRFYSFGDCMLITR